MCTTLTPTTPELTDLSLLVLTNLALDPDIDRRHDRIRSLLSAKCTVDNTGVPAPVSALETARLVSIRRLYDRDASKRIKGWTVCITEKGLHLHRSLMSSLRAAA